MSTIDIGQILLTARLIALVSLLLFSGCTSVLPYSWRTVADRVVLLPTSPRFLGSTKDVLVNVRIDGKARILRYNLDSNSAEEIRPPLPREDSFFLGDVLPSERLIVFSWYSRAKGATEICTMKLDETNFEVITDNGAQSTSPFFSPSGSKIGYLLTRRTELTKTNISIYDRNSRVSRVIPNTTQILMMSPSFGPDENSILLAESYISGLGLNERILSIDSNTGHRDTLLEQQRFLAPISIVPQERIIYYGWEMNSLEAENNYKPYRKERQGFFEYDFRSKQTTFLAEASSTANSFSTSLEYNMVVYEYIEQIGTFDLFSKSERRYTLSKFNLLKASEEHGL